MMYIPGIGSTGPYPLGNPLYKGGSSGYVPQLGMAAPAQQQYGGYMPMQQATASSGTGMSAGAGGTGSGSGGSITIKPPPATPAAPAPKPPPTTGGGIPTTPPSVVADRINQADLFNRQSEWANRDPRGMSNPNAGNNPYMLATAGGASGYHQLGMQSAPVQPLYGNYARNRIA